MNDRRIVLLVFSQEKTILFHSYCEEVKHKRREALLSGSSGGRKDKELDMLDEVRRDRSTVIEFIDVSRQKATY